MAERTKADGNGKDAAAEESAAAALDNAANGSAATPISAARRGKNAADSTDAAGKDTRPAEGAEDESGASGGEQEEAKPVRTAADIVAENKAKQEAEKEQAVKPAESGGTTTVTRPVARKTTATTAKTATTGKTTTAAKTVKDGTPSDGKGRAALSAAGKGLNRARGLLASVIWLIAVLCAAVLALGALFTALSQTNDSNEIVKWVLARGDDLVGPFGDLFKLKTAKNTLLVNWGIAALAYLVVGKLAERIIRP